VRNARHGEPKRLPISYGKLFSDHYNRWAAAPEVVPMKRTTTIASLLFFSVFAAAQTTEPVPVDQEPHHHVLLNNDDVLILRCTLQPGERTFYHTHSYDSIAVELAHATVIQQKWGSTETAADEVHPGELSVRILKGETYTHRISNIGQAEFDVFDVEVLRPSAHPSAALAGTVAVENPGARAYKWTLAPGSVTPMHTHERPYIIVAATAFPLKMIAPGGQSMTHDIKPGDFHWVTSKVTHSLTNEGKIEAQIIEIELK